MEKMAESFCSRCGIRLTGDDPAAALCPTCSTATAIASPQDAAKAKLPGSDTGVREGEPPIYPEWVSSIGKDGPSILLRWLPIFLLVIVVLLGVALVIPAVQKVNQAEARAATMNNFRCIAGACHHFESAVNRLPAPVMFVEHEGKQREVQLSWRVEIEPYTQNSPLYNQFDKKVGWDHPNNARFQKLEVPIYGCAYHDGELPNTRVQFFTGVATLFPANTPIRMAEIKDGTSRTFLFAEANQPVIWTRPADMMVTPNGELPLPPDQFMAAMADGTVHWIVRANINDTILRQLINPNDQKPDGAWDN